MALIQKLDSSNSWQPPRGAVPTFSCPSLWAGLCWAGTLGMSQIQLWSCAWCCVSPLASLRQGPHHSQVTDSKSISEMAGNDSKNCLWGNLSPHFMLSGKERGRKGKRGKRKGENNRILFHFVYGPYLSISWFLLVLVYFVGGI